MTRAKAYVLAAGLAIATFSFGVDPLLANDDCDHDNDGKLATWCGGPDCDDNNNGLIDDWDRDGLTPVVCGGTDCYDNDAACTTNCGGSPACAPYCDVDDDNVTAMLCGGPDCDDNDAGCTFCGTAGCESAPCYNPDIDGDGHDALACGGDDCDDADPDRFPGNVEVCDPVERDEDCNPSTFGYKDADGDGAWDASCCNDEPGTGRICGTDCNDGNPAQHHGLAEVCDGLDNDCDGVSDEGRRITAYDDQDGDGWGDSSTGGSFCPADVLKLLKTPRSGDCADTVQSQHPFAMEVCNGLDDDCDGVLDEGVQGYCD